jgi:NitT/TauT family transport system ATP-binding protein
MDRAIVFSNISVSFPETRGGAFIAVRDATLDVGDGEFVALVGPTGCGKSTLLNLAAGLLQPASGSVSIFGKELRGLNRHAGYLFQADALMPWKTAIENVAIGLEVRGATPASARAEAQQWLAKMGLGNFSGRHPHRLSGGQKKRVALAQVLALKPKILLMDEPFGPLDAQTRALMSELLLALWTQDRKAVLFVTHDLDEAIALSDRVVVMGAGPAATIIADRRVSLPRPRDPVEVRHTPEFSALHREIWHGLKGEVLRAYAQEDKS